jgi:hypothetical protein
MNNEPGRVKVLRDLELYVRTMALTLGKEIGVWVDAFDDLANKPVERPKGPPFFNVLRALVDKSSNDDKKDHQKIERRKGRKTH